MWEHWVTRQPASAQQAQRRGVWHSAQYRFNVVTCLSCGPLFANNRNRLRLSQTIKTDWRDTRKCSIDWKSERIRLGQLQTSVPGIPGIVHFGGWNSWNSAFWRLPAKWLSLSHLLTMCLYVLDSNSWDDLGHVLIIWLRGWRKDVGDFSVLEKSDAWCK